MRVVGVVRDLRFDMELWHHQECQVNLAATTWWYARPGASSNTLAPTTAELTLHPAPMVRWPRVHGGIEGEELRVICPRDGAEPQQINNLSGGWQLWWRGGQKTGDRLELGFDAPTAGTCTVFGRFVHSRDYAIVTTAINDGPAGAPIDLCNDGVRFGKEMPLGTAVLAAGANRLILTIAGANPKAQAPGNLVGLDYIRLQPGTS